MADVEDFILRAPSCPPEADFADDQFNALALRLFELQFAMVAPYQRFCDRRGRTPGLVRRWEEIPALPTAAFKESDVTSLHSGDRAVVFHSSGTTGRDASRHYHNAGSLRLYERSLTSGFAPRLLPDGPESAARLHFVSLTPPRELAPNSSLVHMFETVSREFPWRSRVFAASVDPVEGWVLDPPAALALLDRLARDKSPALLVGTAFSFVHLLDALDAQNRSIILPAGSRAMETGGYKGKSRELPKAQLHAWMARRLGLAPDNIVCEYGMSELSSQAYDAIAGRANPEGRLFSLPPWARARLISPERGLEAAPGEPGLVTLLDLANARSCMALQTEDLGIADGAGFHLLGRAPRAVARGCSLMPA